MLSPLKPVKRDHRNMQVFVELKEGKNKHELEIEQKVPFPIGLRRCNRGSGAMFALYKIYHPN